MVGYRFWIAAFTKPSISFLPSRVFADEVKNLGSPSQNSLMEWRNASWFLWTIVGFALSALVKMRTNGIWASMSHCVNLRSMSCGGILESISTNTQRRDSLLRR